VAWGARSPKQIDTVFSKSEGVIVHYSTRDAARLVKHWPDCYESWRKHQRWHMDNNGWWDLAYNWGVCPHGFAFEGRGWSAQNGANKGFNDKTLSVCYDGDFNDTPLPVVERTFKDLIERAVEKGWDTQVRGHNEVSTTGTPCPGAAIKAGMLPRLKLYAEALSSPPPIQPPPPPPVEPPATAFEKVVVMGPPTTDIAQMQRWAKDNNATELFIGLAPLVWQESIAYGVDPALVYAIMAHETAFGRFGGVLDATFHNWGGMKTPVGGGNYDPNAHHRFETHREGIAAVAQHAGRYAGLELYRPEIVDPRWDRVPEPGAAPSIPDDDWVWASDSHDDRVAAHVKNLRRA
jgi:hypothetical protein